MTEVSITYRWTEDDIGAINAAYARMPGLFEKTRRPKIEVWTVQALFYIAPAICAVLMLGLLGEGWPSAETAREDLRFFGIILASTYAGYSLATHVSRAFASKRPSFWSDSLGKDYRVTIAKEGYRLVGEEVDAWRRWGRDMPVVEVWTTYLFVHHPMGVFIIPERCLGEEPHDVARQISALIENRAAA